MIRKSFVPIEVKVLSEDEGIVEATVSVTANVDRQKDRILPGAFGKAFALATEKGRLPTIVYGHNWDDIHQVLGSAKAWDELEPGSPLLPEKLAAKGLGGLKVQAQMNLDVPAGQVAFSHLKNGHLSEWSFAFEPGEMGYDSKGVREIRSIEEIMELSVVLIGANQDTATMSAKGAEPLSREFLRRLFANGPNPTAEEIEAAYQSVVSSHDRKTRSAARLEEARTAAAALKSDVSSQDQREGARFSISTPDGPKFPINDCSDVADAWKLRGHSTLDQGRVERYIRRAAGKLGCDGPWNEDSGDGKSVAPDLEVKDDHRYELVDDAWVEKAGRVPVLEGEEAAHNEPLATALVAIERLIAQEVAEQEPEFDCVMRLACIGQDLIMWAQGEAMEQQPYDSPMPMAHLMAAGMEAIERKEAATEEVVDPLSEAMSELDVASLIRDARQEARREPPQPSVPELSGEQASLTHFARQRARPR